MAIEVKMYAYYWDWIEWYDIQGERNLFRIDCRTPTYLIQGREARRSNNFDLYVYAEVISEAMVPNHSPVYSHSVIDYHSVSYTVTVITTSNRTQLPETGDSVPGRAKGVQKASVVNVL